MLGWAYLGAFVIRVAMHALWFGEVDLEALGYLAFSAALVVLGYGCSRAVFPGDRHAAMASAVYLLVHPLFSLHATALPAATFGLAALLIFTSTSIRLFKKVFPPLAEDTARVTTTVPQGPDEAFQGPGYVQLSHDVLAIGGFEWIHPCISLALLGFMAGSVVLFATIGVLATAAAYAGMVLAWLIRQRTLGPLYMIGAVVGLLCMAVLLVHGFFYFPVDEVIQWAPEVLFPFLRPAAWVSAAIVLVQLLGYCFVTFWALARGSTTCPHARVVPFLVVLAVLVVLVGPWPALWYFDVLAAPVVDHQLFGWRGGWVKSKIRRVMMLW